MLCLITSQALLYTQCKQQDSIKLNDLDNTLSLFTVLYVILIIIYVKKICEKIKISSKYYNVLAALSRDTLGVYILHVWIKNTEIFQGIMRIMKESGVNMMLSTWIFIFAIFITCTAITEILRRLPILKKLL